MQLFGLQVICFGNNCCSYCTPMVLSTSSRVKALGRGQLHCYLQNSAWDLKWTVSNEPQSFSNKTLALVFTSQAANPCWATSAILLGQRRFVHWVNVEPPDYQPQVNPLCQGWASISHLVGSRVGANVGPKLIFFSVGQRYEMCSFTSVEPALIQLWRVVN